RQRRLLPVGAVELVQIAGDALLNLRHAPLHLGSREVLVTIVHRLELAAIDRDAGFCKQAHGAAEPNKPSADQADGATVVPPEIGDRLGIGNQPACEPHHLNVTPGLTLQPAARLNPVEIAVDVELQKDRRMIRRPAGSLWMGPPEPNRGQIQFIDKDVDYANRIVGIDPVLKAFGKQRALPAIRTLNKALHPVPRKSRRNHTASLTST